MINKKMISINKKENEIIDLIENINDEFDIKIVADPESNNFILNKSFIEPVEITENNYIIQHNNKMIINIYNYVNENYDDVIVKMYTKNINTLELTVENYVDVAILFNRQLLKDIFKSNINLINRNYDENFDEFDIEIIDDNIDYIFNIYSQVSFKNIIELFNEIYNDIINRYNFNNICINIIKLFEFVVADLRKFINNNYIDTDIKIDISNTNILMNNLLSIENIDDIDDIIYDDLSNNIDNELIDIFNIDYEININKYHFYELTYLNNLSNDENIDVDYVYKMKYELPERIFNRYEPVENYIVLNIDTLFKIASQIYKNTNDKKIFYHDIFDIDNIDTIFENLNNSYDNNEFIYLLLDNEYEILYNEFYDKFNYCIGNIKINNIYDVKKVLLNILSNLNLNKQFKFDDELYEIY